jgi:hypothetical protein
MGNDKGITFNDPTHSRKVWGGKAEGSDNKQNVGDQSIETGDGSKLAPGAGGPTKVNNPS